MAVEVENSTEVTQANWIVPRELVRPGEEENRSGVVEDHWCAGGVLLIKLLGDERIHLWQQDTEELTEEARGLIESVLMSRVGEEY